MSLWDTINMKTGGMEERHEEKLKGSKSQSNLRICAHPKLPHVIHPKYMWSMHLDFGCPGSYSTVIVSEILLSKNILCDQNGRRPV